MDSMNSMLEKLYKQVQLLGAKSNSEEEEEVGSEIGSAKILDRAQILFPTFDGTNYREWRAKVEQFFELENAPQAQWGKILLLSMEGKAFVWQRHYKTHNSNKMKSWQ